MVIILRYNFLRRADEAVLGREGVKEGGMFGKFCLAHEACTCIAKPIASFKGFESFFPLPVCMFARNSNFVPERAQALKIQNYRKRCTLTRRDEGKGKGTVTPLI